MGSGFSSVYHRVKSKYRNDTTTNVTLKGARPSSNGLKARRFQDNGSDADQNTEEIDWVVSITKQCKFGLDKCNCRQVLEPPPNSHPVIIDAGSLLTRAGFASDNHPKCIFYTVVRFGSKNEEPSAAPTQTGDQGLIRVGNGTTMTTSTDQPSKFTPVMMYPIIQGSVEDWDNMERVWHHCFYNELRVSPVDLTVVLTEAILTPKQCRERTAFLMFSQFKVSRLIIRDACVFSMYSSPAGGQTGCVLSSGFSMTYAVPVCSYFSVPHAVKKSELAGKLLTEYLGVLVDKENGCKCAISPRQLENMKEKHCFVAEDYELALGEANMKEKPVKCDDNWIITKSSFMCPEAMFGNSPVSMRSSTCVPQLIYNSITDCNADLHKEMWGNIVCTGGNTLLKGFTKRLQTELTILVGSVMRIVVVACDHAHTSWQGARMLTSLPCFDGKLFSYRLSPLFPHMLIT